VRGPERTLKVAECGTCKAMANSVFRRVTKFLKKNRPKTATGPRDVVVPFEEIIQNTCGDLDKGVYHGPILTETCRRLLKDRDFLDNFENTFSRQDIESNEQMAQLKFNACVGIVPGCMNEKFHDLRKKKITKCERCKAVMDLLDATMHLNVGSSWHRTARQFNELADFFCEELHFSFTPIDRKNFDSITDTCDMLIQDHESTVLNFYLHNRHYLKKDPYWICKKTKFCKKTDSLSKFNIPVMSFNPDEDWSLETPEWAKEELETLEKKTIKFGDKIEL